MESVIELIEKGNLIAWNEYPTHVAAGVIKEYLRSLPDPLLTKNLYGEWCALEGK